MRRRPRNPAGSDFQALGNRQRFKESLVLILFGAAGVASAAEGWTVPAVRLAEQRRHPLIACTADELVRIRDAYRGTGPAHEVLADAVKTCDRFLDKPVTFPPRGGQHNQWYQCDACQLALETVSDTEHRCPKCGKVYTGEPYDDVVFKRYHGRNLGQMSQAAWAYAITGDRKYADYAAKILLGYSDRYLKYPYHTSTPTKEGSKRVTGGHIDEQTLGEANILAHHIAPSYDLIHDSPALSEADRTAIEQQLIVPMLRNIDKYKAGKSNWQTWHNAAMLWGGAVIGDASWVEKAIAQPGNGFAFQMTEGVMPEGMWYENSWGYHFYTLHAMVDLAEGSRRLGIGLWSHPNLKKMFLLPMRYAMADGSLPRFGDDVRASVKSIGSLAGPAFMAYRDPLLKPHLPETPTLQSIRLGLSLRARSEQPDLVTVSEVMPGTGHAILRTAGPAGLTAAVTFSPYGGFHGHFDKLSFVFFGHGRELGVDPGRAASQAYRLPIHSQWYKATIGHNAIVIDQQSQKPAQGRLRCFGANREYAAVLADCDAAYEGVTQQRMLVMTPGYLVVFDRLGSSDKERRFDWFYHNRGDRVKCDVAVEKADLSAEPPGYTYIQNARRGTTGEMIRVEFDHGQVTTYLTLNDEPRTQVLIGDGPGSSILDPVPLCMVTRIGREACFAAVLEPVSQSARPRVSSIRRSRQAGGVSLEISRAGGMDVITLADDHSIRVQAAGQTVLDAKP